MTLRTWFYTIVGGFFTVSSIDQFVREKYFLAFGSMVLAMVSIHLYEQESDKE